MSKKGLIATVSALARAGFDNGEIVTLLRAEKTLRRWAELACGNSIRGRSWAIERDEQTNKPYMVTHIYGTTLHTERRAIPDRETSTWNKVCALMQAHPNHVAYHQGDPRGCALYIVALSDIPAGQSLSQYYTRGIACCE